jgi:hypothetical protein
MMLIRISGRACVVDAGGEVVTDPAILRELDASESEEVCSDYLRPELADLGISGGTVRLALEPSGERLRVVTEYRSPVMLDSSQLEKLAADTYGQWSDGIGEGCSQELGLRLVVNIDLSPDGEKPRVEQIDDGVVTYVPDSSLVRAARDGDLVRVRRCLDAGAEREIHFQGYTALHLAILYGHAEIALELVSRGSDVRALDPLGQDALMLTALSNSLSDEQSAWVARSILELGVNVNGSTGCPTDEETALDLARIREKRQMEEVLCQFGAR